MLAWCFSLNGDVEMLLRREGVFSLMILNNDLRMITGNPAAQLNDVQKEIITEIVETEGKYGRDLRIIVEEFYRFVTLILMGLNKFPSPGRCLWRACSPPTSLPASSSTWSSSYR